VRFSMAQADQTTRRRWTYHSDQSQESEQALVEFGKSCTDGSRCSISEHIICVDSLRPMLMDDVELWLPEERFDIEATHFPNDGIDFTKV
jgi:hypothetical protein